MFFDARLKIDRANEHIGDVEAEVFALERHYVSSIEIDRGTRAQSIKHECPGLLDRLSDIALITGDAVHNLRTALDYAWMAVLAALKLTPTKYTKFPFGDTFEALNKTLSERKIDRTSPALFEKLVTDIQPYCGGNDLLWTLHRADITDKHKLLLPVSHCTGASGVRIEDENGVVQTGDLLPRYGSQGVILFDFPPNVKIKDNGKISVSVILLDGPNLAGIPILEELGLLSDSAFNAVKSLEGVALGNKPPGFHKE